MDGHRFATSQCSRLESGGWDGYDAVAAPFKMGTMESPSPAPEKRLTELETLFTHLQRTVQDLDRIVVDQSRQIERMEREVRSLANDVRAMRELNREPRRPEDEIPPHY